MHAGRRPLDGIRVLEMGQILAGPFAGSLLAYFGAEVIKVEPPGAGDPIRRWRHLDTDGTSLWWRSLARNKKCVTIDLRQEAGRDLVRRLLGHCDVLIENFRPGTLERWGLGPDVLRAERPDLIVARISGYGQTGPQASRPGYAAVCEAVGGLRFVTGVPGEAPVRSNLSLGDSLCGLYSALGILMALLERAKPDGGGQVVDCSIVESVFSMLEGAVPEFDRLGVVRQPSGGTITGVVPTGAYPCSDGDFVVIGANSDPVFRRLMQAVGRHDLAEDPRCATNDTRVVHQEELDLAIADFTRERSVANVIEALERAEVPAGRINSVADMVEDPQFQARGLFETVDSGGRPLKLGAMAPKLTATPGRSEWAGRELGADNDEVFRNLLGLSDLELEALCLEGVI